MSGGRRRRPLGTTTGPRLPTWTNPGTTMHMVQLHPHRSTTGCPANRAVVGSACHAQAAGCTLATRTSPPRSQVTATTPAAAARCAPRVPDSHISARQPGLTTGGCQGPIFRQWVSRVYIDKAGRARGLTLCRNNACALQALAGGASSPEDLKAIDEIIKEVDKDNDGRIDYAEFCDMMRGQNGDVLSKAAATPSKPAPAAAKPW
jgi:hypothetical protein